MDGGLLHKVLGSESLALNNVDAPVAPANS